MSVSKRKSVASLISVTAAGTNLFCLVLHRGTTNLRSRREKLRTQMEATIHCRGPVHRHVGFSWDSPISLPDHFTTWWSEFLFFTDRLPNPDTKDRDKNQCGKSPIKWDLWGFMEVQQYPFRRWSLWCVLYMLCTIFVKVQLRINYCPKVFGGIHTRHWLCGILTVEAAKQCETALFLLQRWE